jgi:hypothetical protein
LGHEPPPRPKPTKADIFYKVGFCRHLSAFVGF